MVNHKSLMPKHLKVLDQRPGGVIDTYSLKRTVQYSSDLPYAVTVINPSGVSFTVPAARGDTHHRGCFYITLRYTVPKGYDIDLSRMTDDDVRLKLENSYEFRQLNTMYVRSELANGYECEVTYALDSIHLNNQYDGVMIIDNNIVIRDDLMGPEFTHPELICTEDIPVNETTLKIRVVSPTNVTCNYYYPLGGKIVSVVSSVDERHKPGLYIDYPPTINNAGYSKFIENPEDFSNENVFTTQAEAQAVLDKLPMAIKKVDLENETLKNEINKMKIKHKDEVIDLKQSMKVEVDELKRQIQTDERAFKKESLEMSRRSEIRKEKTEVIKMWPVAITALLGCVSVFAAWRR